MSLSRKLAKHPKVRTGCITCKRRRVKCSEERPQCQRCGVSGLKCEGYNVPRTWLFDPAQMKEHTVGYWKVNQSPSWSRALLPDEADSRSFDLYIHQTAPMLSGYFGYSFWSKTLPQVSFHEPVIKYMVLAISSLVESSELRLSLLHDNMVYQTNYRRAIQRMTSDEAPNTEYILMACLLLTCCEFMLGEFQTGMRHVFSGVRIVGEWYRSKYLDNDVSVTEANLILTELAPLFASIAQKAPTYGLSRCLHPGMMLRPVPCRELPYVAKTFSNIHQARHTLDGIAHNVIRLMDVRDVFDDGPLVSQLKSLLVAYCTALSAFEAQQSCTKRGRLAVWLSLLRAHHKVLTIVISVYPFIHGGVPSYKQHQSDFVFILDQYEKLFAGAVRQSLCPTAMSRDSDTLQWHFGFIPPLFFAAAKSSEKGTRLSAISYLRALRVQEGHWNSCIAAAIAETVLHVSHGSTSMRDHLSLAKISFPGCVSGKSLRWEPIRNIARVYGYQGATMTVPANCNCGTSLQPSKLDKIFAEGQLGRCGDSG